MKIGKLFTDEKWVSSEMLDLSRVTHFGENPFTCILVKEGTLWGWAYHRQRLLAVLNLWGWSREGADWLDQLEDKLSTAGNLSNYLRLTLFRNRELEVGLLVENENRELKSSILKIFSSAQKKGRRILPNEVKWGHYWETELEIESREDSGYTDILFRDQDDFVLEGSKFNLIFKKGENFFTPKVNDRNLLNGVCRQSLLGHSGKDLQLVARDIHYSELMSMESVWGCNALKGIFPISQIDDTEFGIDDKLTGLLNGVWEKEAKRTGLKVK